MNVNLCKLCGERQSKYVCPQCNTDYCSVQCYQSEVHAQCSETFYRKCVVEQMKCEDSDPETHRRMEEILQRNLLYSEDDYVDSDDSDSCEDLAERLAEVDLDDTETVWGILTQDERRQFQQFVRTGDLNDVMPVWNPWWRYRKIKKLVEDLEESILETSPEAKHYTPTIKENIHHISQICRVEPSPLVKYSVANLMAAYAVTTRVYNGDHQSVPLDAAGMLCALSGSLQNSQIFDNEETAVSSVYMVVINGNLFDSIDKDMLREDVSMLMEGPSKTDHSKYILAGLSDISTTLTSAKGKLKHTLKRKADNQRFPKIFPFPDNSDSTFPLLTVQDLNRCLKKVDFYLSWAKTHV
ncbi:zinc finger HIT domain-containing protein 2-like isoform X1 [Homalodisca vitripennis]|uniref:zinc finger HIT domain-containing protein 2-like isoform X1 n=2 Tax=Homalodisca vitripennis TaxID=197043 RepID=UPI001EECB2C0|nr:zinc finger HIT domain-containing protein 2-like isoform X1 [Homalodisca vitripennis]